MEQGGEDDTVLAEDVNERLALLSYDSRYITVKTAVIYWEDERDGFQDEAICLANMLERDLNFPPPEKYAIPSVQSQLCLDNFISGLLLRSNDLIEKFEGPSLLIIHYGGHGDPNNDKHAGEERQSVWAAYEAGGPTLNWFDIQPKLKNSVADVLLLFDCCFGAQAGRERLAPPAVVELLVASAGREKTPRPGPNSFTTAFMRELRASIMKKGSVTVSELHTILSKREAKLFATAVHIKLKHGPRERSIRLSPVAASPTAIASLPESASALTILVRTKEQLDALSINEIVDWLRTDVPSTVASLKVEKLLRIAKRSPAAIAGRGVEHDVFNDLLDRPAHNDILAAWNRVVELVTYKVDRWRVPMETTEDNDILRDRAIKFLARLRESLGAFANTVERNILTSSKLCDKDVLNATIEDGDIKALGLVNDLRLRRMILLRSDDSDSGASMIPSSKQPTSLSILREYKYYRPRENPDDITTSSKRVQKLATLLSTKKSSEFCSLRCVGWYRDLDENRFALEFEIPRSSNNDLPRQTTLTEIISESRMSSRDKSQSLSQPTLGQRFKAAYTIARAVQKWHNFGWVHQGISSPNVVFLYQVDSTVIDMARPFLQGFDFARPNLEASHGTYTEDPEFNVYRHPDRQGPSRQGHRKIHDLYSLGVVLLEIGMWQKATDLVGFKKQSEMKVTKMERRLLRASEHLGLYAGVAFQRAVTVCLTGSFGIELDDASQSHLAKAFHSQVIEELVSCLTLE